MMRRVTPLFVGALVLLGVLTAGCSAGGGGGVIKPEPTKNPMAERAAKTGQQGH